MSESPQISLMRETARHGIGGIEDVADIWLHEGLKRVVELGLGDSIKTSIFNIGVNMKRGIQRIMLR